MSHRQWGFRNQRAFVTTEELLITMSLAAKTSASRALPRSENSRPPRDPITVPKLAILYEDNHLLAISKPAGIATMGVTEDAPSLLREAKGYLKHAYQKPGNVYLGVVSRLDAAVTGVILFARTSKAAARLSLAFRERTVRKTYLAIADPCRLPAQGTLTHWVRKEERLRRMVTCDAGAPGAQEAILSFRTRPHQGIGRCLEIELHTGRKHQIRLQLSAAGCPVVGDAKYGSSQGFARGIALHSARLQFLHPVGGQPLDLTAPVPAYWPTRS
jgi:23S rRNA pseudouridine1911/1915/1917 synthase